MYVKFFFLYTCSLLVNQNGNEKLQLILDNWNKAEMKSSINIRRKT